jgi:hypothetical protein
MVTPQSRRTSPLPGDLTSTEPGASTALHGVHRLGGVYWGAEGDRGSDLPLEQADRPTFLGRASQSRGFVSWTAVGSASLHIGEL